MARRTLRVLRTLAALMILLGGGILALSFSTGAGQTLTAASAPAVVADGGGSSGPCGAGPFSC